MKKRFFILLAIAAIASSGLFAVGFSIGAMGAYGQETVRNGDSDFSLSTTQTKVPVLATLHMDFTDHLALALDGGVDLYLDGDEDVSTAFTADAVIYGRIPAGDVFALNLGLGCGYEMYGKMEAQSDDGSIRGDAVVHTVDVFVSLRPMIRLGSHIGIFADARFGIDVYKAQVFSVGIGGLSGDYTDNLLTDGTFAYRWSAGAGIAVSF